MSVTFNREKEETRNLSEQLAIRDIEQAEMKRRIEELEAIHDDKDAYLGKLEEKTVKYKETVSEESKASRHTSKVLKKRVLEVEEQLKEKTEQAKEANTIIMRVQAKILKYKEKLDESERKREKIEKDIKRLKIDTDECLERERKAHNELQSEFSKRLNERLSEGEKRIRESFESKITNLERELHQKEAQVQKSQFDQLYHQQMINNMKTLQPDQVEKMLEMYESKLKVFQKDYMPRADHDKQVMEMETRFANEKKDLEKKYDYEAEYKMKEFEQKKQKEFNGTLSSIKSAVTGMEEKLEAEKKESKKLKKEKIAYEQEISNMKATIMDMERHSKQLNVHLSDSNSQIDKLKEALNETSSQKKELEIYCQKLAEDVRNINTELENVKRHSLQLDDSVKQKKLDNGRMKDEIARLNRELEMLKTDRMHLETDNMDLKQEHKILKDTVELTLESIVQSLPDQDFKKFRMSYSRKIPESVEGICVEFKKALEELRAYYGKIIKEVSDKSAKEINRLEGVIKTQKMTIKNLYFKLKQNISIARKEIENLKQTAIQTAQSYRTQLQTFSDSIQYKCNEIIVSNEMDISKKRKQLEKESAELRNKYERENMELRTLLGDKEREYAKVIEGYENHVSGLNQTLTIESTERNNMSRKVDDFKKIVKIITDFIPLPSDISKSLLSLQSDIVDRGTQDLTSLLIRNEKEREQSQSEYQRLSEEALNLKQQVMVLDDALKKVEKQKNSIQKQNEQIDSLCKEKYQDLLDNLIEIQNTLTNLEERYRAEISDVGGAVRDSYEKQVSELRSQVSLVQEQTKSALAGNQVASSQMSEVKRKLEESKIENERRQKEMREFKSMMEKEREENQSLKRSMASTESKIKQLEKEKERYKLKSSRNEQKYKELQGFLNNLQSDLKVSMNQSKSEDSITE